MSHMSDVRTPVILSLAVGSASGHHLAVRWYVNVPEHANLAQPSGMMQK
jgi:hypothetical protein